VLGLPAVAGAFDDLTPEAFDLVGSHGAEVIVQRVPGFDLTEERPDAVEPVMPPVLQQAGGFGRDLPAIWIGDPSPLIYLMTQFIDDGGGVVLLLLGGKPLAFVEDQLLLLGRSLTFFGLWNRGDELGAMNSARRRPLMVRWVGWPSVSSSQCSTGYS